MKTPKEFDLYYEKELRLIVSALEARRLDIAKRFSYKRYGRSLIWLLGINITLGIIVGLGLVPNGFMAVTPLSFFYAVFAPLYIFIRRNWSFSPINDDYKKLVIPKVVSFVSADLRYKPTEGLSLPEIEKSELFKKPITFKSEDLVEGAVDGFELRISDIRMTRKENTRTGTTSSTSNTLIHGLYAISKSNRTMPSRVIIRQNNVVSDIVGQAARRLLGDVIVDRVSDHLNSGLFKTGNAEFDRDFKVTAVDAAPAKQLLTPLMIQLMISMRAEVGLELMMSVFDDQIHIACVGVDLFEGDAHRSFVENDISKKYFLYLTGVVGLSEAVRS